MKTLLKKLLTYYIDIHKSIRTEYDHFKLRKKINHLNKHKRSKQLNKQQISGIRNFYSDYGFKNLNCEWHRFYAACNGIYSVEYIPENIFYLILEPKLNRYDFAPALSDKNLLNRLFPNVKQPETIVKNINGIYFHNDEIIDFETVTDLCNQAGKMIIKPSIGGFGGKDVRRFQCSNGITDLLEAPLEKVLTDYKNNFIIQVSILQHPILASLNQSSVNTFRIVTYLTGMEPQILSMFVRMGRKGSINDNMSTGGLACGVKADGKLNEVGYDAFGTKVTETDGGWKFSDISFYFIDKLKETAVMLHKNAPHFRIISWDLTLNPQDEVILIEYNICGQGLNSHQMHNGPVFTKLLQELI